MRIGMLLLVMMMTIVPVATEAFQEQPPAICEGPYGEAQLLRLVGNLPGKRLLFVLPECGVKVEWSADLEAQLKGALRANPELPPVTVEEVLREMLRLAGGRKAGETRVNPKDGLTYVWIPPGEFTMGCTPSEEKEYGRGAEWCNDDEKPARQVKISKGFYLGQREVRVGAYRKYADAMGVKMPDPPHPLGFAKPVNANWANEEQAMVMVTWEEAKGYCEWSIAGGRLPTEAEWEYAARAGTAGSRYGELDRIAWTADNSGRERIDSLSILEENINWEPYAKRLDANENRPPTRSKEGNAWGLQDMLGGVSEWVFDWYESDYYRNRNWRNLDVDPKGPPSGDEKVLRGGSWYYVPIYARASNRNLRRPEVRRSDFGFRCAGDSF